MILKQGKKYEEDGVETEQTEEVKAPSNRTKLIVGVIVLLAVALLAFLLYYQMNFNNHDGDEDPGTEVIEGSDEYWEQFEIPFSYSDEDRESLRAWGYTGTEIEQNEANQVPASDLVDAAKKAREETWAALNNPASPEYQALLDKTWVGQPSIGLPAYTEDVESRITYNSVILNADYEKIPAHGHNLFLKVYIEDGSYVFMECPLSRYMELGDSGNIVVKYDTSTLDGVTIISNVVEVSVN